MTPKTLVDESKRFSAFIRSRVHDPALADDLLQEGFLKAIGAIDSLQNVDRIVPWFFQILRNIITDHFRHSTREQQALTQFAHEPVQLSTDEEIKQLACDCVDFFALSLNPDYAEIIKALDLEDEQPAAFAKRKKLTIGTVKVRRHRARKQLREKILEVCSCMVDRNGCSFNC